MNKEQLVLRLDGCEMGGEISPFLESLAEKDGLVAVYGASDDLVEFRGAINDERYLGDAILLDSKGLLPERDQIEDDDELEKFFSRKKTARKIKAYYGDDDIYYWRFETDIPHAAFDVLEDDEFFCRGIVFSMSDV